MDSSATEEPSIDPNKLSYEIFSILESKFLFGYEDPFHSGATTPRHHHQPNSPAGTRGKVCILSIDGGGMRGIISGKALAYLEQAIKRKSGDPDARIADYLDLVAGTSVGAVFAAMLFAGEKTSGRPVFKAEDTWKLLAEQGRRLFRAPALAPASSPVVSVPHKTKSRKSKSSKPKAVLHRLLHCKGGKGMTVGETIPATSSPPRPAVSPCSTSYSTWSAHSQAQTGSVERVMKELFTNKNSGKELTLRDTLKPILIPCYDLLSSAPFVFSRADALESGGFDFRLWEVCRATSANPARVQPILMKSIDEKTSCVAVDGGLVMNNPTVAAITHVLHNKQEFPFVRGVEDLLVLSLGCGQVMEGGKFEYEQMSKWSLVEWADPLSRVVGDGIADVVDHAVAMAFSNAGSSRNYIRVQASGLSLGRQGGGTGFSDVDFDPAISNVKRLIAAGDEMLKQKNVESVLFSGRRIGEHTNSEKLDWFAEELVTEHRRRSSRIAPTVAFKQLGTTTTTDAITSG